MSLGSKVAVLCVVLAGCAIDPLGPIPDAPRAVLSDPVPPVYLYRPATPGPHRVVVWLHAGGWRSGTAALGLSHPSRVLFQDDIAIASVDYTLSGVAPWPRQIEDVRAAVAWLRDKSDSLNLATDAIGAWGFSAGAHLASHAGTSCTVAAECVQAVVTWSAPSDLVRMNQDLVAKGCTRRSEAVGSEEYDLLDHTLPSLSPWTVDASPALQASFGDAPHLIFHGLSDCTVPVAQAGRLHAKLTTAGVPSARFQYQTGHLTTVFASDSALARVRAFFATHLP